MADQRPGDESRGAPRPPGGVAADWESARRPGHWFPLLLFGVLAALSLPLSVLGSPPLSIRSAVLTVEIYPTVTQAMYFGGGSATTPFPFPLGWYWVGALVAGSLLTAAWYRWHDSRAPVRGYLVTGLGLAVATAALPMLAWGMPAQMDGAGMRAWVWLDAFWRLGTFALLAVAVSLGMLARIGRSRALAMITVIYTAAVCFAGWLDLRQAISLPFFYPFGDTAVLLPAAVLLLAGLGTLGAGLHGLRPRSAAS